MQILKEELTVPGTVFEDREIPSDRALLTPTIVRLMDRLTEEKCVGTEGRSKYELCFDEAITNAIVHGNGEDFTKMVRVRLWKNEHEWGVVVQDQGGGFSLEDLENRGEDDDLWQESGRGLALMTLYMDCVLYYDNGSTLLLRKFIDLGSE